MDLSYVVEHVPEICCAGYTSSWLLVRHPGATIVVLIYNATYVTEVVEIVILVEAYQAVLSLIYHATYHYAEDAEILILIEAYQAILSLIYHATYHYAEVAEIVILIEAYQAVLSCNGLNVGYKNCNID